MAKRKLANIGVVCRRQTYLEKVLVLTEMVMG